jgi:ABC-type Fe3+-hydroxamate transport system substrate-binding protein
MNITKSPWLASLHGSKPPLKHKYQFLSFEFAVALVRPFGTLSSTDFTKKDVTMKTSSRLAAVLMLASLVGFQTQVDNETRQVTDADGKTQVLPAQPKRVVVLSKIDLDSALTLGLQPVGTVNGRGQSTLPRYLLQQAI